VKTKDLAGAAVALTNASGTILQATAGATTIGGRRKITPETIFWIASMTKPITSVAALQLVEQGKLELDAPIGGILPELATPQVLENGALRPAATAITLRHLLTHTAGFSYPASNPALAAYAAAHPNPPPPGSRAALAMPLVHDPGTAWEYGVSTDWVGLAVEAASGKSLDTYFRDHIFAPLGMADTGFTLTSDQKSRRAALHHRSPAGKLTAMPPTLPAQAAYLSGGGGLFSTLIDYQKFMRAILSGGAGLLGPKNMEALRTNQIGAINATTFPGQPGKWSFGFLLNPEPGPFGRGKNSLFWAGMANTYFWIDPTNNLAGMALTQIIPSGDPAALKIFMQLEKAAYGR
jgi:CubicO group peptidase (beta-lactamase class C family)